MTRPDSLPRRARMAACLLLAMLALPARPAAAQEAAGPGFTPDPGEPIEVVSDTAEWKRAENMAIFTGRVDAVQGTMRLRADKVYVHYLPRGADAAAQGTQGKQGTQDAKQGTQDAKEEGASGASGQRITKIDARGNVIITDVNDQTATGDWAIYDVPGRRITMGDTVVLTQGENVIRGQKLISNLDTGETRVIAGETGAAGTQGGRVRSLFVTEGEGKADAASGNPAPGTLPSENPGGARSGGEHSGGENSGGENSGRTGAPASGAGSAP